MATKKRKDDDEAGIEKKRRKSGVAANGSELHEEQQPIVRANSHRFQVDASKFHVLATVMAHICLTNGHIV